MDTDLDTVIEELETEKERVAELRKHCDKMAADLTQLEQLKTQVSELETTRSDLETKVKELKVIFIL